MELEEMKKLWDNMSEEISKQKILTDKLIIDITKEKYKNRLLRISIPEKIGAVISYTTAFIIILNFKKFDTWYLIALAITSMLIICILPLLSLKAIHKMNNINIGTSNYKSTISEYTKGKKLFYLAGKLGMLFGFLLLFFIIPVFSKIFNNKDIFIKSEKYFNSYTFITSLLFGIIFFIVFTRWVLKYYSKTITGVENILKELEN